MRSREQILVKLRENKPVFTGFGINSVGLFGSYARNEQSSQSDIDLLIDFYPGKENYDNFMMACDFFESLFNNNKVEVITRNGLSPYIGPKILNEVLYV